MLYWNYQYSIQGTSYPISRMPYGKMSGSKLLKVSLRRSLHALMPCPLITVATISSSSQQLRGKKCKLLVHYPWKLPSDLIWCTSLGQQYVWQPPCSCPTQTCWPALGTWPLPKWWCWVCHWPTRLVVQVVSHLPTTLAYGPRLFNYTWWVLLWSSFISMDWFYYSYIYRCWMAIQPWLPTPFTCPLPALCAIHASTPLSWHLEPIETCRRWWCEEGQWNARCWR